ncbi:MAG: diaminopimelate epimerase [Lachnospiraceae bacterium]|nr:diaminopimelate epimerase [Lachnospiraceae bacterium]
MKFTKMHGCGNDYIYFDCTKEPLENPAELAVRLSDRHFGVGGDGIILIKPSQKADFYMEMYNADGSQGKMCGNGIRCVAKLAYDTGLTNKTHLTVDTLSGVKTLELTVENGKVTWVTVDMGRPSLVPEEIPLLAEKQALRYPICADGKTYEMTAVSVGNPHAVIRVEDVESFPVEQAGAPIEVHPMFPEKVNVEFVQVIDRSQVSMRVWERGSGETWACGTGACATAVACYKNGWTDAEVTVHLWGGDLKIRYDADADKVFMTGPAETVFTGELE